MIIWLNKHMYDVMITLITSFLWNKLNMNLPRFLTRATSRRQVILRKHAKGFVWMCMYSSQFTCVKVDWNGIKPSFIPIHFNTHRLKYTYIQIRPKKDAKDVVVFFLKLGGKHRFVVSLHCS
jgi:hypothetical protein